MLPPGAVGGLYGSGCFHFSNSCFVSSIIACILTLAIRCLFLTSSDLTYGLLSGLCDVLVRFEERSDVHGLSAPDVSVDGPVEGELEGTAVEVAVVWKC